MPEIIDWQRPPRRRGLFFLLLAVLVSVIFGGRTALSYYVEALWFGSLGYGNVFRKTLSLQWGTFAIFSAVTFLILYGWFLTLRRAYQNDLPIGRRIFIGGQPLNLPLDLTISVTELYHKYRDGQILLVPFSYHYASLSDLVYQFLGDITSFVPVGAWLVVQYAPRRETRRRRKSRHRIPDAAGRSSRRSMRTCPDA